MNAYLEEFPPDIEGQETTPLPVDETMDIIYHSVPTTWKKKMTEQGFNHADDTVKEVTDIFETRVDNLEPKEEKKKLQQLTEKTNKKILKKRK